MRYFDPNGRRVVGRDAFRAFDRSVRARNSRSRAWPKGRAFRLRSTYMSCLTDPMKEYYKIRTHFRSPGFLHAYQDFFRIAATVSQWQTPLYFMSEPSNNQNA